MNKRGLKFIAINELFLLVMFVFAGAFILEESGFVEGQETVVRGKFVNSPGSFKRVFVPDTQGNTLVTFNEQGRIISRAGANPDPLAPKSGTTNPTDAELPKGEEGAGFDPFTYSSYSGVDSGIGALAHSLVWAAAAYLIVKGITSLFGVDGALSDALSNAAAAGVGVGVFINDLLIAEEAVGWFAKDGIIAGLTTGPTLIGLAVAIIVFVATYKDQKADLVKFECLPYEPPLGGRDCEICNNDPFRPCSEYRCKSLGQACELVNEGSVEERCVWVNPRDSTSPTITPWDKPLNEGLRYTNHDVRPPSLGAKIIDTRKSDGCLQAFTPLSFGFATNEPAQCKIDYVHTNTTDEMKFFVGESNFFRLNHTQTMSLPSPDSVNAESPEILNDGNYQFFVRCRDKNGNENVDEFAVQFCVDPSPDTTPPLIVDTSIINGAPVRFGVNEVPLTTYINEPAECRWSVQDKSYDVMENQMSCATSVLEVNARELYACSTTLTGVKNREENKFYFRCRDQPGKPDNERNTNVGGYGFVLRGSQELNIIETGPNSTIRGSTSSVRVELKVKTDDGSNEGNALCAFSNEEDGGYIAMFETGGFEHRQVLSLTEGDYEYFFRCVDLGGNAAEASVRFGVESDNNPPGVTRAFYDGGNNALRITTNEDAMCVYSLNNCNYVFDEGIEMIQNPPSVKNQHFAEWKPFNAYYIKCRDDFGNEPSPNECSIIVSAVSN